MTKLIELREVVRSFYGKYEYYITPAIRFITALITFFIINGNIGYMERLDNPVVPLVLALVCTFLPATTIALMAAVLITLHLFALSLEACVIVLLLFLLMFFLYYKYAPKTGFCIILTPVLCRLNIGEIMPTVLGLYRNPYSVLSMICGMMVYYVLNGIRNNAAMLRTASDEAILTKFTFVLDQIIDNRELFVTILAYVITTIIIYVIRNLSVKHAWTVAVCVGNFVNFMILIVGRFWLGITKELIWIILGVLLSVGIGLVLQFFLFHLDHTRVEQVQFEDDEYYYYVKAVPKIYISAGQKEIKQINTRKVVEGINKQELAEEFDIDQKLFEE